MMTAYFEQNTYKFIWMVWFQYTKFVFISGYFIKTNMAMNQFFNEQENLQH